MVIEGFADLMRSKKCGITGLAVKSGYSESTIVHMRRGIHVKPSTAAVIMQTLMHEQLQQRDPRGAK